MRPREITDADMAYWADCNPRRVTFTAPGEVEAGIEPCPGIVTDDPDDQSPIARVAWQLDEIELAHLARTGTIWLSCWGGLPVHMMEVQAP